MDRITPDLGKPARRCGNLKLRRTDTLISLPREKRSSNFETKAADFFRLVIAAPNADFFGLRCLDERQRSREGRDLHRDFQNSPLELAWQAVRVLAEQAAEAWTGERLPPARRGRRSDTEVAVGMPGFRLRNKEFNQLH